MATVGNLTYITRTNAETGKAVPASGRRKVFISYKKSDNRVTGVRDTVAQKILSIVDCAVWYDEALTPGINYIDEIKAAISECDAIVLLLTQDILESEFVWDIEIKTAIEQKKGIIPLAFDLAPSKYSVAEEKLGGKMQILRWPSTEGSEDSDEMERFDDALERALDRFVINTVLALRVARFFASDRHLVSYSKLTPEDRYLMGWGYLSGYGTSKDIQKGVSLLESVTAVYGDDAETTKLKCDAALELSKHMFNAKDFEKAVMYAESAAKAGHIGVLYSLGRLYNDGSYVKNTVMQDKKKAAYLYKLAADNGSSPAMTGLGLMYMKGDGVPKDEAKGVEYYKKASSLGSSAAMFNLGVYYFHSKTNRDINQAISYYAQAAKLGSSGAMNNLGSIYYNGDEVEKDYDRAYALYQRAASLGDVSAISNIGIMYQNGAGRPKDYAKAIEYYSKAAERGSANAMCALAGMYARGEGVAVDYAKALELYTKAAEDNYSRAVWNIGMLYYNGQGVEKDKKKAVEYYKKAVDMGDVFAENLLAACYYRGYGVMRNRKKAINMYLQAAEKDSAEALCSLSDIYRNGKGVKKDVAKANAFLEKAFDLGSGVAAHALGSIYYTGRGAKRDREKGINYFEIGAERDNSESLFLLGCLYYQGKHVEYNEEKAAQCFERAIALGNKKAEKYYKILQM